MYWIGLLIGPLFSPQGSGPAWGLKALNEYNYKVTKPCTEACCLEKTNFWVVIFPAYVYEHSLESYQFWKKQIAGWPHSHSFSYVCVDIFLTTVRIKAGGERGEIVGERLHLWASFPANRQNPYQDREWEAGHTGISKKGKNRIKLLVAWHLVGQQDWSHFICGKRC